MSDVPRQPRGPVSHGVSQCAGPWRRAALAALLGGALTLCGPSRDAEAAPAKTAQAKPAKKAPAAPARSKGAGKSNPAAPKAPRKAGSEPGEPSASARASIAGDSPRDGAGDSPELSALKEVDQALFPEEGEAGQAPLVELRAPKIVHQSGLPPTRDERPPSSEPADLKWMAKLSPPDIPYRWDARLVRYLDYFKNNPKGRSFVAVMMKRSGRYEASIRAALKARGMPEDIVYLALVESGMNPRIASPVGAAGLWQFMPKAGQAYGLRIDRWVDERLDPERSTDAALRYLSDLHQRFGRWELAFAAYNMGHGGLLTAIRKYNTNDFWELSHVEAGVPYETALYVPKIVALAFVARNREVFGCHELTPDPPEPLAPGGRVASERAKSSPPGSKPQPDDERDAEHEWIEVGPGTPVDAIAKAAGVSSEVLLALNPQLLGQMTPPAPNDQATTFAIRVPKGSAELVRQRLPAGKTSGLERHVLVWGESLERLAAERGVTEAKLRALNGLGTGAPPRPGTPLLVPTGRSAKSAMDPLVAVVPSRATPPVGHRRVLYEVVWGDRVEEVARVLGVGVGDLCHWNNIDPSAKLHGKMVLQAFVKEASSLSGVRVVEERDAKLLVVGSTEFFDHFESKNGRVRLVVTVKEGDSLASLAKRHGISVGMLERINHRSRSAALEPGEQLVVYAKQATAPVAAASKSSSSVATQTPSEQDADESDATADLGG
jgi:membrane-bound lytic murein transglycosylase D